jgi:protein-S-isoprenylcysteine O-methyltransferase Ste14
MQPNQIGLAGVLGSWLVVVISLWRARGASLRARGRTRSFGGLFGILLQAIAFGIAFGWRRSSLSSFLGDSLEARWLVATIALVLSLASTIFLVAALRALGKQWSLLPRLVEEHDLIESGPYSVIRHPIYVSMLGLLLATGLTFSTIGGVIVAVPLYLAGTLLRIKIEEALLRTMFGGKYISYAQRVPGFIPFGRNRGVGRIDSI